MLKNLLLLLGFGVILFSYSKLGILYFKSRKKKVKDVTGFEFAKEITRNYDVINIVESKKIILSQYDFKRGIIRLTPDIYEDTSTFSLAVAGQLAGYSLGSFQKSCYFEFVKKVFPTIDWLNKSGFIAMFISGITFKGMDAKLGIILLCLILLYQYFILQMNTCSMECLESYLSNKSVEEVMKGFHSLHKRLFIATLILILRNVVIVLGL